MTYIHIKLNQTSTTYSKDNMWTYEQIMLFMWFSVPVIGMFAYISVRYVCPPSAREEQIHIVIPTHTVEPIYAVEPLEVAEPIQGPVYSTEPIQVAEGLPDLTGEVLYI
jgi:hypothetical protein